MEVDEARAACAPPLPTPDPACPPDATLLHEGRHPITSLAAHGSSVAILSSCFEGDIWSSTVTTTSLQLKSSTLHLHDTAACLSWYSASMLAIGSDSGDILLLNDSKLAHSLGWHAAPILDLNCDVQGGGIITSSRDATLALWGGVTHRVPLATITVPGLTCMSAVQVVCATGSEDGSLALWDVRDFTRSVGGTATPVPVAAMRMLTQHSVLLVGIDSSMRWMDMRAMRASVGEVLSPPQPSTCRAIAVMHAAGDVHDVALTYDDSTLHLWRCDAGSGAGERRLVTRPHTGYLRAASWMQTEDARYVITGGWDGRVVAQQVRRE